MSAPGSRPASVLSELSGPWSGASRWAAFGLICALAVLLALWEVFLVPLRVGGVPVPIAALLAPVTTLVLGLAGAVVLGQRAGAVVPGLLWTAVPVLLSLGGSGGDSITPSSSVGSLCWLAVITLGPVGAAYAVLGAGRAAELGQSADR